MKKRLKWFGIVLGGLIILAVLVVVGLSITGASRLNKTRHVNELPEPKLTLLGNILMGAGLMGNVFAAEYIDHDLPFPEMPELGANEAYGQYLAGLCTGCHGANLAGGQPSNPESPPAPNLTPGGELQGWTEADFITAMRTGITPTGRQLNPLFMPWESVGKLDDDELRGLWLYLESLPPQPTTAN